MYLWEFPFWECYKLLTEIVLNYHHAISEMTCSTLYLSNDERHLSREVGEQYSI